jgi:drug/metabolite transporter (DMT)-like permease
MLVAGTPLVGAVFALATGGADRFGGTGLVGLLVGMLGVGAIVGTDLGTTDPTAFLMVLGVVVGYAVGPAILARRLGGVPSLGVMAVSLAGVAVLYAPIAALQWPAAIPPRDVLVAVIVLAVVCTAAAFLVFAALVAEIGPVRATVITYVNPAVAAVLGVVVLHETLTPAMAVGFGLVILGSALATRPARDAPLESRAEPAGSQG